ncbi:hypothetical protein C8R43DRAFT_1130627 [Mycena crocata]|nr:hypothetical protein C8R43DRAFT_1130627 [Mycena crocata]
MKDQIRRISRRLRHLSLSLPYNEVEDVFAFPRAEDFPDLQSINFRGLRSINHPPTEFWKGLHLFQMPSLHHVSLRMRGDPLTLPLVWSQLTELSLMCHYFRSGGNTLGGLDQNTAFDAPQRCPNLVCCGLKLTKYSMFSPGQSTTLLNLEVLILGGYSEPQNMMQSLVLPRLWYFGIGENPAGISHLRIASDEVKLVVSEESYVSQDTLLELLVILPSDAPMACPALTHLELCFCDFTDAVLLAFITARMHTTTTIRRLETSFRRPKDLDIESELRVFTAAELQLVLHYEPPPPSEGIFNARDGLSKLGYS